MEIEQLTEQTINIAREAGKTIMSSYTHIQQDAIQRKSSYQDLVTQVDQLTERQIIADLRKITPTAGFLGEETGIKNANSPIKWVIDPIDGTRYFARNLPMFSVTIAMTYENKPQIGVIHQPASSQTFYGFVGGGGYLDGQRLNGSQVSTLSDAIVYVDTDSLHKLPDSERDWFDTKILDLMRACYRVRMLGASSIAATWLATGAIDAFIDLTGYNPTWDMLAPQVIMSETGARQQYLQVEVGPPRFIAANENLWNALVEILNKTD